MNNLAVGGNRHNPPVFGLNDGSGNAPSHSTGKEFAQLLKTPSSDEPKPSAAPPPPDDNTSDLDRAQEQARLQNQAQTQARAQTRARARDQAHTDGQARAQDRVQDDSQDGPQDTDGVDRQARAQNRSAGAAGGKSSTSKPAPANQDNRNPETARSENAGARPARADDKIAPPAKEVASASDKTDKTDRDEDPHWPPAGLAGLGITALPAAATAPTAPTAPTSATAPTVAGAPLLGGVVPPSGLVGTTPTLAAALPGTGTALTAIAAQAGPAAAIHGATATQGAATAQGSSPAAAIQGAAAQASGAAAAAGATFGTLLQAAASKTTPADPNDNSAIARSDSSNADAMTMIAAGGTTHTLASRSADSAAPFSGSPTPTPELHGHNFEDAIGARMSWLADQKIGHAHIKLSPADLGPVDVRLHLNGDQVNASFSSAHADVRQALENSLPRLREMLGQHGFQLGQADVGQQHQHASQNAAHGAAPGSADSGDDVLGSVGIPAQVLRRRGLLDAYA